MSDEEIFSRVEELLYEIDSRYLGNAQDEAVELSNAYKEMTEANKKAGVERLIKHIDKIKVSLHEASVLLDRI